MSDTLNLDAITLEAYGALCKADKNLIGTSDYVGLAWFWNYAYRHYLRDATYYQRRRIHNKALTEGISFYDVGLRQFKILRDILRLGIPTDKQIAILMIEYSKKEDRHEQRKNKAPLHSS